MEKLTEKQFTAAAKKLQDKLEHGQYNADKFDIKRKDNRVILTGEKIQFAYDTDSAKLLITGCDGEFPAHEAKRLEIICNNWQSEI